MGMVTRELGIRSIWIDALCRFQAQDHPDSRDDWMREAGGMRDVYRGAVVTIDESKRELEAILLAAVGR
jgi:hypothetical protein